MVRKCFHVSNDFDLNLPVLSLQINFYVTIQVLKDFGTGEMIKVVVFGVLWMCLWDCSDISTWHSCVLPIHEPGCVSSTSDLSQVTPVCCCPFRYDFLMENNPQASVFKWCWELHQKQNSGHFRLLLFLKGYSIIVLKQNRKVAGHGSTLCQNDFHLQDALSCSHTLI